MDSSRGRSSLGLPAGNTHTRQVARLPFSPMQPVQDTVANNLAGGCGFEGSVDERQTFGDFLMLIGGLLECNEVRAALVLLENLASSKFADSELQCTQPEFKDHIADCVSTSTPEFSVEASDLIQCWCDGDYELEIMSSPGDLSPAVSHAPISLQSPTYRSSRRGRSPTRRSPSRTSTSCASVGSPRHADANPPFLPAVDGPRRSIPFCGDRDSLPSPVASFNLTDFVASHGDDEFGGQSHGSRRHEGAEGLSLRPRGLPSLQNTRRPRSAHQEETRRR